MFRAVNLAKYPFLRILLPLLTGICIGEAFPEERGGAGFLLMGTEVLVSFVCFSIHWFWPAHTRRWLFGAGLFGTLLWFGQLWVVLADRRIDWQWDDEPQTYRAELLDAPQLKERSVLFRVRLTEQRVGDEWQPVDRNILLYVAKDSSSLAVRLEDDLMFHARVSSPVNRGNPYEFDYAGFLHHRGISGTAYADSGHWRKMAHVGRMGWKRRALLVREKILQGYREAGISGDEFAVLSALTVGYKEELSPDIRDAYAVAGISHVLALSGLHVGVLYVVLLLLLGFAGGRNRFRRPKGMLLLIVMWTFAFVSGLSPSVVRAVVMFTALEVGRMFGWQRTGLNTVGMAAFFMLVWNPYYLYDVGFQLSFMAVGCLVWLLPQFHKRFAIQNRWVGRLVDWLLVGALAQLSLLPLLLYYFSRFPVYSLLANLPAVVLAYLILYMAILVLLLGFLLPSLLPFAASFLGSLVGYLNNVAEWVRGLPASSVECLSFGLADVCGCYLLFLLMALRVLFQVRVRLFWMGAVVSFLVLSRLVGHVSSLAGSPQVVFYNSSVPVVQYFCPCRQSYLQVGGEDGRKEWMYATEGYRKYRRIRENVLLTSDYADGHVRLCNGIVAFGRCTVCLVTDSRWDGKVAGKPLHVDYLYLSGGYKGNVESLTQVFCIRKVVLNGSLGKYRLRRLQDECRALGLDCVSLPDNGALQVNI